MLAQVNNRLLNKGANGTLMMCTVAMLIIIAGCSSNLPHRVQPKHLGVKQQQSNDLDHPDEYVFCSPGVGPWGCTEPTQKTKIAGSKDQDNGAINSKVKSTLDTLKDRYQVLPGEKAIPETPPLLTVYFDFDSSRLKPEAKLSLINAIGSLKGKTIELHGYTDNVGEQRYNNSLGKKRADAVLVYLKQSLPTVNQSAYGHGLCCYKVPNDTEEQRAMNRRVEIYAAE